MMKGIINMNFDCMENVLIIGAHYDDAELGAGGTAAALISKGKNVYKLTLTDNETKFEQMNIVVDSENSKKQSEKAASIIGYKEISCFKPQKCSHLTYSTELMQRIESIIFDLKIDTVFMHFQTDMNQDHVEASRLCLTASRHCRNVLAYQGNGYILDQAYYPTFFVDISDYVELKKKALQCYGAEHNRFGGLFEINIERNRIWGFANKVKYAEGFHIIKMLF